MRDIVVSFSSVKDIGDELLFVFCSCQYAVVVFYLKSSVYSALIDAMAKSDMYIFPFSFGKTFPSF